MSASAPASLAGALRQNAIFSALSGTVMVFVPGQVAAFLGIGPSWLYLAVGIGLWLFAADLLHQTRQPRLSPGRAMLSSAGDFLWVLGTLIFLLFWGDRVSEQGAVALLIIAVLVLQFGLRQAAGIRALMREDGVAGAASHGQ